MMIAVEAKICEKRSKTWSGHCMQRHNSQATVTGNARTGKTPGMELAIKMDMEWLVSAILFPSAGTTTDLVNSVPVLVSQSLRSDLMAPKKEKAPPPSSKPAKSGGGKQKKKKWSKGKQKEKVNNMVLFDQGTYDKLLTEAPKYKLITPSILSDRLRISGSLARKAIRELMARGVIRMVSAHSSQQIYTRATNT
ncbi:hypothetical protein QYF36_000201 [Acer negundo]|nr:hypothetical protein QYF36_000201 [Acer negundo]